MKKIVVIGILVAIVVGIGAWYYLFYRPTHFKRDVQEEVAITITAKEIVKEYQANEEAANKKYLNKAVEITGEVLEAKKNQDAQPTLTLKSDDSFSNIYCTLKGTEQEQLKGNQVVSVKGICTGFLSDVVLIDAIITKK